MDTQFKIGVIITSLLTATAITAVRSQDTSLLIVSIIALIILAIILRGPFLVGLGTILSLIYPLQNWGWLYGRDTHFAAYYTVKIAETGWPTSGPVTRGFPDSPLLHIYAVIGSEITGLHIFPTVEPRLLITALLPLSFTACTLAIVYIIGRQTVSGRRSYLTEFTIFPVLLWAPMFKFMTAFRRGALALPVFLFGTYFLYRYHRSPDRRYVAAILGTGFVLPIAHHFTALLYVGLCGLTFLVEQITRSRLSQKVDDLVHIRRRTPPLSWTVVVLVAGLFLTWYFYSGLGAERLVAYTVNILKGLAADTSSGAPVFEVNLLERYRRTLGPTIFVGILVFAYSIALFRRQRVNSLDIIVLGFGAVLAGLYALGPFVTMPVGGTRILMFFVVPSGGFTLYRFLETTSQSRLELASYSIIILLVITSVGMVHPHHIGIGQPNYAQGQTSQVFQGPDQAVGQFVETHSSEQRLFGDLNTKETVEPRSERRVHMDYPVLHGRNNPPESLFILHNRNREILRSYQYGAWLPTEPGIVAGYDSQTNRIYHSGEFRVWKS